MSWSASRWVLAALLGALAALVPAAPADAHAVLVGSEPAAGAVVPGPLAAVTLRFSEPVSARQTGADLLDGAGHRVTGVSTRVDRQVLRLALPALPAGTYGVAWHALGDTDGHLTRGMLVFSLGRPSPATALAAPATAGTEPTPFGVARRVVRLAALCATAGAAVVAALTLAASHRRPRDATRPPVDAVARPVRRRLLALSAAGAAVALLVGLLDLTVQADRSDASPWALLSGTGWGALWAVGMTAAALAVLAATRLRAERPARAWWYALTAAIATAAAAQGAGTHAGPSALGWAAAGAHTLAAAVWLGAVGSLPLMVRAAPDPDGTVAATGRLALLRACAPALYRTLVVAVLVAVGTGLYLAGREVGPAGDLLRTRFGGTLTVKLGCVALVGALALANAARWRRSRPAARTGRRAGRFILAEALAGALVLVAAGLLVETSPTAAAAPAPAGSTGTAILDDLVVTVSVTPNTPGPNGVTVVVSSTRRPPPGVVDRVTLGVPVPGTAGTGVLDLSPDGSGRFFGAGPLPAAGRTALTVTVHRSGADLPVTVPWTVGPALAVRPAAGMRLATLATPAGALLVAAGLGLGLWWGGLRRRQWRLTPAPPVPESRALEDV